MKSRILAFFCFVCLVVSCLAPLSVSAAPETWSGWSGSSYQVKDGVLYLGANAELRKSISLPDSYTVKMTARIIKKEGSMGFYIMDNGIRSGLYMSTNGFDTFGGQYYQGNVGNGWHDYVLEVKGDQNYAYMDGELLLSGPANSYTGTGTIRFFVTGNGALEIESFEVIIPGATYDGGILNTPLEDEYAQEFTVDWSDPESYKDWTITPSEDIKIDAENGILSIVPDGTTSYYQVERAPKIPENFDFEFRMKIEDYGSHTFMVKATHQGDNNYQYYQDDRIAMTTEEFAKSGGMGLQVDIGKEWHDWKYEVRGDYMTMYIDGGELYRFKQVYSPNQTPILRFLCNTVEDSYKIHLGKVHYKPYFPEATLTAPANGSEFVEGSDIVFNAEVTEALDYVDYYVNGLNVGRGYAPGYEYVMKNAKMGTYRVSAGIGDEQGIESVIKVQKGFNANLKAENTTVKFGESTTVSLEYERLQIAESAKPNKVEYYADGYYLATSTVEPFAYEFKPSKVGTTAVYAKVSNANGAHYLTDKLFVESVADGTTPVTFGREYELDFDYAGENATLEVSDGYFALNAKFEGDKLVYDSNEGTKEVTLGKGKYKIVTTSGLVDLYYNGHFAKSWLMNRTTAENVVKQTGLSNFEMGGTGVKTEFYSEKWKGEGNYSHQLTDVARNYSVEFDKTDVSDETIAFYDGDYEIKIDFKDGKMHTKNQDIEIGEARPFTLSGDAKPGYYRITVAKGLAQVFIDNVYVDSFAAPSNTARPTIVRTMTNPAASTIVAVKATNDHYYHNDDFSENKEMSALDYWVSDYFDTLTPSIAKDGDNQVLKLEGKGEYLLNAQSDNFKMKWSAKVSGTNKFYLTPRLFRGPYYHMNVGYDFTKGKWYLYQWSNDRRYYVDKTHEFDAPKLTENVWHDFEIELVENELVLKMDGIEVIKTDKVDMPFWGYTGFGIDGGSVLIDNLEYEGPCKVTAGIISSFISDSAGICEFYETSTGRVIADSGWANYVYTDDGGKTWSEPAKSLNSGKNLENVIRLQDGRLFRLEGSKNITGMVSEDDGKTWTATGSIDDSVRVTRRRIVLNGSVIQSSTGRIHVACDEGYSEENSITGLYYTDDFGATWHEAETIMGQPTKDVISTETVGFNFQEGGMTELPDGTIRYTARTGLGFIYYMDSHDGGVTFGEFRPSQFINPLCSYAIERDNKDPNIYYAWIEYDATTYCYRYIHSPRNRMALMISYDGAKTWEYVMTVNEWADYPLFDACNHSLRVLGDTIYLNWNNLDRPRRSLIYAIDKTKIRSTKRFEEVHERTFRGAMGGETFEDQVIIPKTTGEGYIYGNQVNVDVKDGMYTAKTVGEIFGASYEENGDAVTFRMGDGTVKFTNGSSEYEVNGVKKTFTENCMQSGALNIKACAEAFGKNITEAENSYVIWYGQPVVEQYLQGYLECI